MNKLMQLIAPGKYGLRVDGTHKERGFLGEIPTPTGDVMTEFSVNVDGREIPSIVPTLHPSELNYIIQTGMVPESAIPKIYQHAVQRNRAGKSPFWNTEQDQ